MSNYLCVHEGGSYIAFLSEEAAIKRWALTVYQSRCHVFRLGERMLFMRVDDEKLNVSWIPVKVEQ